MNRRQSVFVLFGTRPEAIKLAPLIELLGRPGGPFHPKVVVTAQHREMLDQVLDLFQITPDYDLDIMSPNQTLFDVSARALRGFEEILIEEKPAIVLVQGDTTSSLMGALSAFYCQIPVGHVEAGLRSYDKYRPFPEEMNRRLVSHIADLHFAPTTLAAENLLREGVDKDKVFVTGNTVIDALRETVKKKRPYGNPLLDELDFKTRRLVLATAHRRENWGLPMKNICRALLTLVEWFSDIVVVFSVHKNPKVREVVEKMLSGQERIHLIEPLEYGPFCRLMSESHLILTDSGGIQEEAPSLGKPVLVLREVTERPEGVEAGTVRLVGVSAGKIAQEASRLLSDRGEYEKMSRAVNPYGDGKASARIVKILECLLAGGPEER